MGTWIECGFTAVNKANHSQRQLAPGLSLTQLLSRSYPSRPFLPAVSLVFSVSQTLGSRSRHEASRTILCPCVPAGRLLRLRGDFRWQSAGVGAAELVSSE